MPKLSVVVPVYFNEANLPDTVPQLLELQTRLPGYELELVFVDDGSQDRSLEILLDFHKHEPERVRVVKLTRNFGSMSAVQAGFTQATGDCIGLIAADLQDPPELFSEMVRHWERGVRMVLAVREDREDPPANRWFASAYYALMRRFAIPDYPKGGCDFLLVDRRVVEDVNSIAEKNTNLVSLIFWLGYRPTLIPYVRRRRTKGRSRWTIGKKIKLVIDSFVAFSYVPIRFVSVMGLVFAASAFIYGGVVFYAWWASDIEVKGWTALMILLTFTAGVQMTMLGVLGEYLWRTLDEARKRPTYVIDRIYG